MGPGKLVRHMQNPSYIYDEYLICIGLGPSISSVICKNMSYSVPSYPSSPVLETGLAIYAEGRFIPCQKGVSGVLPEIGFWHFWHLIRQNLNDIKHKISFVSPSK